jgi:LmbE family N-acetylglucosaminyl deacetylase
MPSGGACGAVLVLVAHPDDETIFMGGLIGRLVAIGQRVDVACATGHFGSPALTRTRHEEFTAAGLALETGTRFLGLADEAGPLPMRELERELQALAGCGYRAVYTHGVFGEYGHRHHRDVCLAAHRVFGRRTVCLAGPLAPSLRCVLTPDELERKRGIAAACYRSQPGVAAWCSAEERYTRLAPASAACLIGLANGVLDRRIATSAAAPELRALVARCQRAFLTREVPYAELAGLPDSLWRPSQRRFAGLCSALMRIWDTA